ncbi:hypothetical protein [Oleiharenicola sp. Vm1]|uniref:hypothetical protein n=1 Tax=Oleiharenicola sp. Vm1 TaxID=3398393 RepID=UPI0039F5DCB4
MKRVIILFMAVALVGGLFGLRSFMRQEARLVIANESTEVLFDLSVKVWDQNFVLGTLRPGEKKEVRISQYSDSAWQISGRWAEGTPLREQAGYITHGMSFDDRAVFGRDRKLSFSSDPR